MLIYIIIILTICLLLFLVCNYSYKKTNDYLNSQLDIRGFMDGIQDGLRLVNTGSTYSKFAFSYLKGNNFKYADFSLRSQSLEMDLAVLRRYVCHIAKGGVVVVVVVAPCLLLFREEGRNLQYYSILKSSENPQFHKKDYLKSRFPLAVNPKKILRLLVDQKEIKSIYETCPNQISKQESEAELDNLCNVWRRLFNIKDFVKVQLSEENKKNIERNKNILADILYLCKSRELIPVVVVPPFSERLNKYFSHEFTELVLEKNIREITEKWNVPYLNYQFDEQFQNLPELFADGGFRLNRRGSRIFVDRLCRDLFQYGIKIDNHGLGWSK